jgi:hypothetical protein
LKLKEKIELEKNKYDFKVIKRKLKDEDNIYLSQEELSMRLRMPHI